MMNKQTLKIKAKFNDEIVAISGSTSSYIDNAFYREKLGEAQGEDLVELLYGEEFKNYPVSTWAFRIDWIL